jgi:hypothetical protein
METKEIAMQKRTTMMGTACVLAAAALTTGPAAASTLTDFAGVLTTSYGQDDNSLASDNLNSWLIGGSAAGPLSDIANLNFQVDASYTHNWADDFSQEVWNFGASVFWANADGRVGANLAYTNYNGIGHLTNGGAFAEWYFGPITVMGKGGWLSSGGASFGGHGNYLGAGATGYVMPDLAITGGVQWADIVTGTGCQICGRGDLRATAWGAEVEFLFMEDLGISGYGGYTYQDNKAFQIDSHDNIWRIGLRWYMGGGSLVDHHRNGNLNPWLPGIGTNMAF